MRMPADSHQQDEGRGHAPSADSTAPARVPSIQTPTPRGPAWWPACVALGIVVVMLSLVFLLNSR